MNFEASFNVLPKRRSSLVFSLSPFGSIGTAPNNRLQRTSWIKCPELNVVTRPLNRDVWRCNR